MTQKSTTAVLSRRDVLRGLGELAVTLPLTSLIRRPGQAFGAGPHSKKKALAAVVQGNNQFAFDLYAKLRGQSGNLFLSPYSISTALAMTYAGAGGRTAAQMAKTLRFTLDPEKLHPGFAAVAREVNGAGKPRAYELRVANALWGQQGEHFLPGFLKLTRDHYGAAFHLTDFAGQTEGARRAINAWVEKQTKNKIKELFRPGVLTSLTRLVLTNAIYFKGDWQSAFPKKKTAPGDFLLTAGGKVRAPLMHQEQKLNYHDGGTFQMLELPYKGGELAMVVLLPKKTDGLAELEKSLTAERLTAALARLKLHQVKVTLPPFRVTAEFSLNQTLAALGMPDAFDRRVADFSGMNGKKNLFLQAVVHKAFVDVNEEGTEAAVATGVGVGLASYTPPPPRAVFRADHPFVYLIRDRRTASILFLGRLTKPQA
jgi:serpin B